MQCLEMQGAEVFSSAMAESNGHRQDSQGRTWASIVRTDRQLMTEQAKGLENLYPYSKVTAWSVVREWTLYYEVKENNHS